MDSLKYFLVGILCFLGPLLVAQDLLVTLSPLLDSEDLELSEYKFDQIVGASKKTMNKYNKSATIFDENLGMVSPESMEQFRSLFTDNAKIVNDLFEQLMAGRRVDNYITDVMDHLPKEGVNFDMFSASIRDISYDKAGFYKVEVQTQKTIFNGLNFDNSKMRCKSGRVYFMIFTLFIEKDDLSTAKIHKIRGEIKKRCEDASPTIGVHLKAGTDLSGGSGFNDHKSPQPNRAVYQGENADFGIDVESFRVLGLGVSLNYPLTTKDLLFFSAQLNYEFSRVNTTAQGTYFFVDENSKNQVNFDPSANLLDYEYQKFVAMDVTEQAAFHRVELPIGLMYKKKFKKNDRLAVGIHGWLVASFNIFQNIESSVKDLQYWANIDFAGQNLGIDFQDDLGNMNLESFGIGTVEDFSSNNIEVNVKTSFSVRLSPYVQFVLNEDKSASIEIALEYNKGLGSFINHSSESELFLQDVGDDLQNVEEELGRSLLEDYFTRSSLNTLGIRIGYLKNFGN